MNSDAQIFSLIHNAKYFSMNGIWSSSSDVVSLVGDPKYLAFVSIERHEPLLFPFLDIMKVLMEGFCVSDSVNGSVEEGVVSVESYG